MSVTHSYISCAKNHLKRCFRHIFFNFLVFCTVFLGIFGGIYGFDGLIGIYYLILGHVIYSWFLIPMYILVSYIISSFCILKIERKINIVLMLILIAFVCTSISEYLHYIQVLDTNIKFDWK